MKKVLECGLLVLVAGCLLSLGMDWAVLKQDIVRLHVVGASNDPQAQEIKLQVRDAVLERMGAELAQVKDAQEAKDWIENHLGDLEDAANKVLEDAGSPDRAKAVLKKEEFPIRVYDTFSLPAGVYDSLRITIGEGAGRNWWCVVFPSLCIPETAEEFATVAVGAGFSQDLTAALTEEYEVRFLLLDLLGRVENFFHQE